MLTRAACRATRQWWSILLCGTLLEACLALGPQIRRAAKLGNPFSTYTKKRDARSRRQRLQRSVYVSRGFRRVGTTTSISPGVHWAGRGRFPDPHISTGANSDPQQLSRYSSAEAEFLRVRRRNTPSRLPEPVPRHSPMSLTPCQSRPAIDAAIYRPDGTSYQLQPSFHTD